MKKIAILLLLGCFLCRFSLPAQSADERSIADRVEMLRKALISADKQVLDELAAAELSYGHSTGLIEDKAAFIDDLVNKKTVLTAIDLSDQSIKISGDVAVVRHRMKADLNNNNTPSKVDLMVLLVWQKQRGKWKLLARQAARLPEQK